MDYKTNQQKIIIASAALFVVAVIVLIFSLIYLRAGRQPVQVTIVPKDARVSSPIGELGEGTHYLPYGSYTTTTHMNGFHEVKQQVTVTETTDNLFFSTLPENDEGERYLDNNPDQERRYEVVGGARSQLAGEQTKEIYSFIDQLPFANYKDSYSLHYGVDEQSDNLVYFVVGESSTAGRKKAIKWLEDKGVDVSVTDIRYSTYVSPLESEVTLEDIRNE